MIRTRFFLIKQFWILLSLLILVPAHAAAIGWGSIAVASTPSGAAITLDNTTFDGMIRTPYTFMDVPAGGHEIVLTLKGYEEYRGIVQVKGGETAPVTAQLNKQGEGPPTHGTLSVMSTPYTVYGTIRSSDTTRAPVTFTTPYAVEFMQPGTYTIELTSAGYHPWTTTVQVVIGKTTYVFGELEQVRPVNCSLVMRSTPSGAYVFLDGIYRGRTPALISPVVSNKHSISIEYPGYADDKRVVFLRNGALTTIDVQLTTVNEPSIIVNTAPLGASILIDERIHGTSPETFTDIEPGIHAVSLHSAGYRDTTRIVSVREDIPVTLADGMEPREREATLVVTAEPEGSYVYIDGFLKGSAPATITDITGGTHLLEVEQAGYRTWRQTIDVADSGITHAIAPLHPEPVPTAGTIAVQTAPAGATVYLDGGYIGITHQNRELVIPAVPAGNHTVLAYLNGTISWTREVTVLAGRTEHIVLPLTTFNTVSSENASSITVHSCPTGADVYLDNIFKGTTPVTIEHVKGGQHTVDLRSETYQPWSQRMQVTAGTPLSVNAELERRSVVLPFTSNTILAVAVTIQGIILILIAGFLFAARIKKA